MNMVSHDPDSRGSLRDPHATPVLEVARHFEVEPASGLSEVEAGRRREQFGANDLSRERGRRWWTILAGQFTNVVVALLAVAAVISWLTSDHLEASAIVVVLLLNALIGFVTEFQAGRALDALRRHLQTVATVRRGGSELLLDATELVPGDVVLLQAGDRVPADIRIFESARLRTQESGLTGESDPVEKGHEPVQPDTVLAERASMLFLGTTITSGRGEGIVVATGAGSELGKIGQLVKETESEKTPLEKRLGQLGKRLVLLVLVIGGIVTISGWLRGEPIWRMLEVGISLAVAAVPEGLPAVTTLILAFGVLRMAREKAIVRRLAAVETLGSTTVICSDKTGTLTLNRMTVREYVLSSGRNLDGHAAVGDSPVDEALLSRLLRASVLCNDAKEGSDGHSIGDPTETALIDAAFARGIDVAATRASAVRTGEDPFDPATKRMITEHQLNNGRTVVTMKGGPAAVLDLCSRYVDGEGDEAPLTEARRKELLEINEGMAGRALRVLAFADGVGARASCELVFLGFAGLIDPPRPEVAAAIEKAHLAGIRVVMLTGDQVSTARAIARELRLVTGREPQVVHASELSGAGDVKYLALAQTADVFARVSPEDKLRIVEALRESGEVVAVTGDGVNDAPALKRADIGVAMGKRGTEVAKEAADIVLADDNFATIVEAIRGGRTIYANITKFVHMMFSHNLAEVLLVFVAILAGWPLPLLPLQILWINLVTDVFPALALALEPSSPRIMEQPPRPTREAIVSARFFLLVVWQGALLAGIALFVYYWSLGRYGAGEHAQTLALLAIIAVQLGHVPNCRSRVRSAFEGVFDNPYLWGAGAIVVALQMIAVFFSPLAAVLHLVRPSALDWMMVVLATVIPIGVVELQKLLFRSFRGRTPSPPVTPASPQIPSTDG